MEISRQDLLERFQALSDDALLDRFNAGTLTPLASEVALAELRSRGIEVTASSDAVDEPEEAVDSDPNVDLVTVAQFFNPWDANVLRACLESHEIFAFVWGEHLSGARPVFSPTTGGASVQVRHDQLEQAKEIVSAIERGDLAIEEDHE